MLRHIGEDIWAHEKDIPLPGGMSMPGRATILRLRDCQLVVHSPLAIDDATAEEIAALGEVRYVIAPNTYHWLFLKAAKEGGETLLDRTMELYGSNLGDANAHSTTNLPTLLAGGGFKHGRHLAFDRTRNYPLPNLYVSMLQRLGIEAASFGPSTGTMRGLEAD